jgi:NAD-dependent SIR2 family protein deacetylase
MTYRIDDDPQTAHLAGFLAGCGPVVALTGAGCSTDSGIPDYRDSSGRWKRAAPVTIQDFLAREEVRRRYWARSQVGWPRFAAAIPNRSHAALAALEHHGLLSAVLTQNVDGLHQRAGSCAVTELHGNLASAHCLACNVSVPRQDIQLELEQHNPHLANAPAATAPDGDADIDAALLAGYLPPRCAQCGGDLRPAVVFFGESVPVRVVEHGMRMLDGAGALLCVGSSLSVYSAYRFCRRAAERGIPIVAINRGRTRADALLTIKLDAPCGPALDAIARRLGATGAAGSA